MTAIPRLRLGTNGLTSQAAPAPPPTTGIRRPEQLRAGAEVWVYFRRWRPGTVRRVIERDPKFAKRGAARGNVVVVQLDEERSSNLTVRRPVAEVILASDSPPPTDHTRQQAQEFAREWWIEQDRSLASSL